jgi:putative Holliday junction resolvase
MIVAGIDYGRARIGLAVAVDGRTVVPIGAIAERSRAASLEVLGRHLRELRVEQVIVGLPLNRDGSAGPQAQAAERFAAALRQTTGLQIAMCDERLTSFEARERLRTRPGRPRRNHGTIDAIAACAILETWLENHRR